MLDRIRAAETDRDLKDLVKQYLASESKRIRDDILTGLLGKHSPQDVAEDLEINYTTIYKSLTGSRKSASGFSFPLSKFGDFCRMYLNSSVQHILYREEKPITLSILMSKVAEILMSADEELCLAILKKAESALAGQPEAQVGFKDDASFVALFRRRSTEIVQDIGATTPARNDRLHIQAAAREMATTFSSTGPLSFSTICASAFKYDVPIDYLLLKDYVSMNTVITRNGEVVEDESVRKILSCLERLDEEIRIPIITDILRLAM